VNFARSFLSEQFAEVWLFFQGALFLIVDGASDGSGLAAAVSRVGRPKQIATYPSLEENPEVQRERQNLGN